MKRLHSIALTFALGLAACGHSQPAKPRSPDPLAGASAKLLLERGRHFAAGGDTIRAEQYFVAASRRGADDAVVVPLLLDTCIRGQRFRAALVHAERFLEHSPRDRALRQMSAVLYLATGQPDKARDALERVVAVAPDEPEPRYLLAVAHTELGQPRRAAPHLRRYLALSPSGERSEEARSWLRAARAVRRQKRRGR
ncbi:MAG TPA: tetratricopeptide repeat protein [Kofleriaceae bacterium]|nr:tetratricopeptide repeat protein [Kofleriaceae bacterium]